MKIILLASLLTLAVFVSACGVTNRWTYPPDEGGISRLYTKPRLPVKVAVAPFKDMRKNKNRDWLWVQYFPLAPYGWMGSDRPETSKHFMTIDSYQVNPTEDFAKAVARSLKDANLFREVYFSHGGESDRADFILEGEIYSSYYEGKAMTYCLSIVGKIFYVIGLPDTVSSNEMRLRLYLVNTKTDERVWEYSFNKNWWIAQGWYYNGGADIVGYPTLMQEGLKEAIYNLDKKIDMTTAEDWKKAGDRGQESGVRSEKSERRKWDMGHGE